MWKYLILHQESARPDKCVGWRQYDGPMPVNGVLAYGYVYSKEPLTWEDVDRYDLFPCGYYPEVRESDF